jgi:cell division protein FtsB
VRKSRLVIFGYFASMPTRLKKPSVAKQLAISATLLAFLAYLGVNSLSGQFGIENREEMFAEIEVLKVETAVLQAEIYALRHRVSLFDRSQIDPDILTERARALLSMASPDDIILLLDSN